MKPDSVNILGITYSITYVDSPIEVDIYKRESLGGQIDYWTRSIRIFNSGSAEDVFNTVMHEVLHGIVTGFNLKSLQGETSHGDLELLACALSDVLYRNGWIISDPK